MSRSGNLLFSVMEFAEEEEADVPEESR